MLKRILFIVAVVIAFGQSLYSADYYNYGQWHFSGYSAGGFIDKNGKLGEKGKEYIFHINGSTGYIHRVDTEGDPQRHPDNPNDTGKIASRKFTLISSHTISNAAGGASSFHIDDSGIYYGPSGGIKRWNFDWSNETTVVATSFSGETFARNTRTGDWWAGNGSRQIYKWDGHQWAYQFTYPNLGGSHHDGMTIANDTLFLSDMTSDYIATYKLDAKGNVINLSAPDHIYSYSASPVVENMGYGPNNHIWITSGSVIYEIGGGKLQEQLAECSQGLIIPDKWEMRSSRCDIKKSTGFKDAVIMKMVSDKLVIITDDNTTKTYYSDLGYDVNSSLALSRGEGFWVRAKTAGIRHVLVGEEATTTLHLKKDTTRFIGLPDYHKLDLDEAFGDKPVKEVRYWDSNLSIWRKWQPNHADTNLTEIVNGHGFYICVADDFDISLPNLPPVAKILGDQNVTIGQTLHLDGSSSFDRDGTIVAYEWKEGNNTLSTTDTLEKDDFELGWHKVVLTVTDDDGATGSKEVIVRVSRINKLPTVSLGEDRNITEGESLTLTPDVHDPDGYILTYAWRVDNSVVATTPYLTLDDLPLGEHNVTLEVIDNDLGHANDSALITVNPTPDTTAPVITVLGDNPSILHIGNTYHDKGAVAIDDRDGNVSVDSNGSVNVNQAGSYTIDYSAEDHAGNRAQASRSVIVQDPLSNLSPTVDAGSDQSIVEGEKVTLSAFAEDSDGSIVKYEWKEESLIVALGQSIEVSNLSVGLHNFTVVVTDNDGAVASDSVVVKVIPKDELDTTPPVITILGDNPAMLTIGDDYNDSGAFAIDDKDGNVSVGTSYRIDTHTAGVYLVTYIASDRAGNKATAHRSVLVKESNNTTPDTTPPVITLLGNNPFILMQGEAFNDPGAVVVDNRDGQLGYTMRHNVNSNRVGKYRVVYDAKDQAGNIAESNRTVIVRDKSGNRAPIANAGQDITIGIGARVTLDGSQSSDIDGDIVSYVWKEGNTTLSHAVTFDKSDFAQGRHSITLTITDNEGATGSDTVSIRVTDPHDTTPPLAAITSPTDNTIVTLKTDIIGTASDANLDDYTLSISPVGKNTYTEFARGTSSVTKNVLGTLDATTVRNGIYDIRLTAVDANGASTTAYTKVIIKGKAKIGNFSFTVTDFDIKVGGIPVQVNRTYSTLQRFEKSDFTYGWSIDYQNVKIEENIHPGKDWKTTPDVLLGYCFKDKKQHIVNLSLPDGTTESFELKFARECAHYYPGHFYDAPILKPLNGTEATLKAVDASDTVMMNDFGEIIDSHTLKLYNPSIYQLTLPNGMVYTIHQEKGIQKVQDPRGDYLVYNANGIISSRGESLTFERDSQDRITKITDLAGKSVTYHYNQNDDLDYVIDQMGQKTTYTYQAGHLLEEYYDPSGLRLTKNIYDASGRLIKTIDADGNVVEFTHDIDGKEELVKDKLGRSSVFVYDDKGNVLSQANPLGETTTRTYDEHGHELSITDPLGNTITNEYDTKGNLLSTTDALGHSETTTYNDKQSPTTVTDKNGHTMRIVYNDYNNPRSFTTASGDTSTYWYDKFGNKIESINEYNQTTKYKYDGHFLPVLGIVSSKGNLLKETRPDGTIIEHTYDESSNLLSTTTTTAEGNVTSTSNAYDAFNRLISSTDEFNNTTTNTYDARGNKTQEEDAQGRVTKYTYNAHSKITKTTYPDGTTESKTYDAMDNLLSETNKEGETTSYEYDDADRLTKTTYPDGSTTTNTYDAAGRLTSTTDQNAHTTTYEYDAVGNKVSTTDALGNKTTFTYDAQGNMLAVTNAENQTTSYAYNALNQRVKTTYPDGTTLHESKNISGLPSAKTDEAGHTTQYAYDTSKTIPLLRQVTLANNAVTQYTYDSQGKKTAQTDALGHSTSWSYTDKGQLHTETLPKGDTKTFTYDSHGKQTQVKDYANKAQKFIYDSYDRLVRIEQADGSTTTYAYTPSGRVKTITDAQGTITNTYDSRGRLTSQTAPSGETISYDYDGVGNIVEIQTPQTTITKTYDALNRLKTVTDSQGTVTYAYDGIGRQARITYPNGITTSYSYDSRNHITSIVHKKSDGTVLQSFAYTLDQVGNRTKIVEATGRTVDYTYNEVHQLTKEVVTNDPNGNNTTTSFTYDDVGNLKTKTINGVPTDYAYNANDQLTTQGSVTFTYDANGNLITKGDTTYEYDDKNRLIKVTTPNNTVEYSYDANNNRIAKTTNQGTTTYLIDANTPYAQVITESKEDGTTVEYTYGNDLLSDGTHSFLTDALGSTRGLVDSSETLTDSYSYTPYGKLDTHTGTSENNFLFTGEQYDKQTGNYYLRARYYDPSAGRFISRDTYAGTMNNPITLNHYLYAGSSPSMHVDPSGNAFTMAEVSFGIATIGAFGAVVLPKMAGRHTINSGLFKIFISGGIGQFSVPLVGAYVAQAVAHDLSLAQELDRERTKEAQRVDRRRRNRKVVYHYTDRISAMLISVTRQLKVTPKHFKSGAPEGAYATEIEPWDVSYTQRELSQLFYGGSIHRDVSWFVAIDASPFICRFDTKECYIGGTGRGYVPIDVITIGKNLMLPDRR